MYQLVELYRRSPEGWLLHVFGPDDTIELASLGISFPIAALYKYTEVPEDLDLPEGEV